MVKNMDHITVFCETTKITNFNMFGNQEQMFLNKECTYIYQESKLWMFALDKQYYYYIF